jgi:hypothetical protein
MFSLFVTFLELWEVHPDTLELTQLQNAHRKFGDEDKCSQGDDDSSMSEDEEHGALHNDENDDSASDADDDDTDAPAASVNKFDLLADDD